MQMAFGFGAGEDLAWVRDRLDAGLGPAGPVVLRTPVGQLVKSLISSRTKDEVSLAAYKRLIAAYPDWTDMAAASSEALETLIGDVTYADVKARHLGSTVRSLAALDPPFDLTFLGTVDVLEALAWLERLPGVGRKVAASALNFSTLERPAFVVDTHVLRVMRRFGFVGSGADTPTVHEAVMTMADGWTSTDLTEIHILVKRLGQLFCRAERPCCAACPIRARCRTAVIRPAGSAPRPPR